MFETEAPYAAVPHPHPFPPACADWGILRTAEFEGGLRWDEGSKRAALGDVLRVHDWNYVRRIQVRWGQLAASTQRTHPLLLRVLIQLQCRAGATGQGASELCGTAQASQACLPASHLLPPPCPPDGVRLPAGRP